MIGKAEFEEERWNIYVGWILNNKNRRFGIGKFMVMNFYEI